jgi:hypothetical protein
MADLTVTASQVLPDTAYPIRTGIAAVAITPGQVVCYDPATLTVKLWDANDSAVNTLQPGIAVGQAAAAGQSVSWQESPGAEITLGAGAAPVNGTVYVGSANAGGIAPVADLAAGWARAVLGVGKTTNKIKLIAVNTLVIG